MPNANIKWRISIRGCLRSKSSRRLCHSKTKFFSFLLLLCLQNYYIKIVFFLVQINNSHIVAFGPFRSRLRSRFCSHWLLLWSANLQRRMDFESTFAGVHFFVNCWLTLHLKVLLIRLRADSRTPTHLEWKSDWQCVHSKSGNPDTPGQ